jgi:hypothetical protein
LRVGEVYAGLALCRRNQVTHGPIVRWRTPASMPTGVQPSGQTAAAKGDFPSFRELRQREVRGTTPLRS